MLLLGTPIKKRVASITLIGFSWNLAWYFFLSWWKYKSSLTSFSFSVSPIASASELESLSRTSFSHSLSWPTLSKLYIRHLSATLSVKISIRAAVGIASWNKIIANLCGRRADLVESVHRHPSLYHQILDRLIPKFLHRRLYIGKQHN